MRLTPINNMNYTGTSYGLIDTSAVFFGTCYYDKILQFMIQVRRFLIDGSMTECKIYSIPYFH
jgi:hypothetical protein